MFSDILGSEFHTQGHSAHLPVVEFPAGTLAFALVESHANVDLDQFRLQFARGVEDGSLFFVGLEDRDDDDLIGSKLRRQDQALIVAVDHDDGPNDARGEPPRSRPAMLLLTILVEVLNLEGLCEILPQKV